jgi:crotonobetainyl-CoA:carnitine CoA-transferase CaiB-like acyl-CoA transferase|tara:strand:+ start:306 stop:1451 length:1146 start_codon:yes stop_codon:yes gene_type:complete
VALKPALDGLKVFEIGSSVAGPYGAWILAQFGAEVIKVERPVTGDDARHWGPPFWHGAAAYFQALNRDKFGITIDFKNPDEVKRLKRLIVESGGVVLQNFRPGLVAELGISAADIRGENSQIIYCNIGAFGDAGPYKERRGYDPLMQASAGLMSVTGEGGERPPVRVGTSIIDMGTGMWTALGIMAAVRQRDESGEGCTIDASLYETAIAWMTYHAAAYDASGDIPKAAGSGMNAIVPYQAYECSDGYLVVAAGGDSLFIKLSKVLGHPEWADDARFKSNPDRVQNRDAINGAITAVMQKENRAYWQEALEKGGIPNAPILHMGEVLSHPQTEELGIVQQDPTVADMRLVGLPMKFNGERPPYRRSPPALGQDNEDIFGTE